MVKGTDKMSAGAARVAKHRHSLREAGMKPVQLWLHDTAHPDVSLFLSNLCRDIENYPGAEDDRAFIYALAEDVE